LYDEKFTKPEEIVNFRIGIDENLKDVKSRILKLFGNVKSKYSAIRDLNDTIGLSEHAIAYVV
jgi:type I restriction enzyme M protein